jgi:hypothetical protein
MKKTMATFLLTMLPALAPAAGLDAMTGSWELEKAFGAIATSCPKKVSIRSENGGAYLFTVDGATSTVASSGEASDRVRAGSEMSTRTVERAADGGIVSGSVWTPKTAGEWALGVGLMRWSLKDGKLLLKKEGVTYQKPETEAEATDPMAAAEGGWGFYHWSAACRYGKTAQ